MARPLEFDSTTITKLEEAFALDCSIPEACFYANISKQSYYNHVGKGAKFKKTCGFTSIELFDRFEALRNKPILLARQTVVKSLKDNPEMALKYLERKSRSEFSTRVETDITSKGERIAIPTEEAHRAISVLNEEEIN